MLAHVLLARTLAREQRFALTSNGSPWRAAFHFAGRCASRKCRANQRATELNRTLFEIRAHCDLNLRKYFTGYGAWWR
jgi:hypothetical protein